MLRVIPVHSPTGQQGWWHQIPVYIGKHCKTKLPHPFGVYEWKTFKHPLPAIKEEKEAVRQKEKEENGAEGKKNKDVGGK